MGCKGLVDQVGMLGTVQMMKIDAEDHKFIILTDDKSVLTIN